MREQQSPYDPSDTPLHLAVLFLVARDPEFERPVYRDPLSICFARSLQPRKQLRPDIRLFLTSGTPSPFRISRCNRTIELPFGAQTVCVCVRARYRVVSDKVELWTSADSKFDDKKWTAPVAAIGQNVEACNVSIASETEALLTQCQQGVEAS